MVDWARAGEGARPVSRAEALTRAHKGRRPKAEGRKKAEIRNPNNPPARRADSGIGLRPSDFFRVSGFGIRVSTISSFIASPGQVPSVWPFRACEYRRLRPGFPW